MQKTLLTDLYEVTEFIDYYLSGSQKELRARLKSIESRSNTYQVFKNEKKALVALLI